MAYMSQEKKSKLAPAIKLLCKKYGIKATLAVDNHSTLCLNIKQGPIDFIGNYNEVVGPSQRFGTSPVEKYLRVNEYHYQNHFTGKAKKFLSEVIPLMNIGNHDRSDIQTDYFDVGWYINVSIGKWNKPYELLK